MRASRVHAASSSYVIAMAHYQGETLNQRLERGPLPVAEAVEILRQVALGLRPRTALASSTETSSRRELHVDAVLTGKVNQRSDRLTIQADLINVGRLREAKVNPLFGSRGPSRASTRS